jgi:hypothetical protein
MNVACSLPTAHCPLPTHPPQVTYGDLPAIISMNEAVAAGSFLYSNEKGCGDVDKAFASGACEVGAGCPGLTCRLLVRTGVAAVTREQLAV